MIGIGLVFAQGNGIQVTLNDLYPYIEGFHSIHGHYPKTKEEKIEIIRNCLADKLILKRAEDLKIYTDPHFTDIWRETKEYVKEKCNKEKISKEKCNEISKNFRKIILIESVLSKELPKFITKETKSIGWLINIHSNLKNKIPPEKIRGFIRDSSLKAAFENYINHLMKKYRVKINYKALDSFPSYP